jgi:hypothetical protein
LNRLNEKFNSRDLQSKIGLQFKSRAKTLSLVDGKSFNNQISFTSEADVDFDNKQDENEKSSSTLQ